MSYREGETVMGNFKGMGDWDEAVVVGVKPGGLYVLDYTDEGLIEEDVPASRIMRQGGAGAADARRAGASPHGPRCVRSRAACATRTCRPQASAAPPSPR